MISAVKERAQQTNYNMKFLVEVNNTEVKLAPQKKVNKKNLPLPNPCLTRPDIEYTRITLRPQILEAFFTLSSTHQ